MGVELPTILLVAPFKSAELRVGQYLSPPLGIYRIASYLKKKGITVRVIDCNLEGEDKFSETIKETHFDIIGFSLLYSTLKNDIRLMYSAIELSPDSLLIAGGQGAVFSIDFLLKNTPLDIIVKGFGEYTLSNMLDNFFSEGSLKDRFGHINSIAFKDGKNIHHTELLENYTPDMFKGISMSFDFDFVPYEKYWEFMEEYYSAEHLSMMRNENMLKTIRLITSSSCLMGCSFCSSTNFLKTAISSPQKLHSLSADEILSLIRKAKQAHPGVTAFYFCDDDFLQRRKRVAELCDLLARDSEFRNITFFCLSRIDRVDSNLLEKLNKANFKFIIYGVESFSDSILSDINKKIPGENKASIIEEAIEKTVENGITPLMNIILFYPTSKISDILKTIEESVKMVKKGARLTVYSYVEVYPGSSILNRDSLSLPIKTYVQIG